MALVHSTLFYITLPWLYFTLLDYTLLYLGSSLIYFTLFWFYFTLLYSTIFYNGSPSLYFTLHWLYFTLLYSILLYHGDRWTKLIALIFSQVIIAKQACSQDLQEEGVTKMPGYVDM